MAEIQVRDNYDMAVLRYGQNIVERGNDLMLEVEHHRERIAFYEGEGNAAEAKGARVDVKTAIGHAADEAVRGNPYLREIAEREPELQREIQQREQGISINPKAISPLYVREVIALISKKFEEAENLLTNKEAKQQFQSVKNDTLQILNGRLNDVRVERAVADSESRVEHRSLREKADQIKPQDRASEQSQQSDNQATKVKEKAPQNSRSAKQGRAAEEQQNKTERSRGDDNVR